MSRKAHARSLRTTVAPLALAIALGLAAGTSNAANIVVDTTDVSSSPDHCSLPDAVKAMNTQTVQGTCAAGDGINDTIDLTQFTAPATISLTQGVALSGHALVFNEAAIIRGNLANGVPLVTIQRSTVTGTAAFGLIQTTSTLGVYGVTLSNGDSGTYAGGAILAGDSLTVKDSVITNNTSGSGGGGISASKMASISTSTVSNNTTVNAGGGIFTSGGLQIDHSTITGNTTTSSDPRSNGGAGIYSTASVTLDTVTVSNNTSATAGGGIRAGGSVNFTNSTISGNKALGGNGGGVFDMGTGVSSQNSTIVGNTASGNGGGAYGSDVRLTNSTVTGNNASGKGGAAYATTLETTYATIADNTSTGAGGGVNFGTGADAQGTIFFGNTPDDLTTASTATLLGDYNIIGSTTVTVSGMRVTCSDPLLGALADNGGPTQTMALASGSCAIDAAGTTPPTSATTDQRGFPRPFGTATPAKADVGAYEFGSMDPDVIFANGFE